MVFSVGVDALSLGQQLHGGQTAVAGQHFEMLTVRGEDDDEVLQQAQAGNARGQFGNGQARVVRALRLERRGSSRESGTRIRFRVWSATSSATAPAMAVVS